MFFDSLINLFISSFFYSLFFKLYYILDKGFFELIGPRGISSFYEKVWVSMGKHLYNGKNWEHLYLIAMTAFFIFIVLILII